MTSICWSVGAALAVHVAIAACQIEPESLHTPHHRQVLHKPALEQRVSAVETSLLRHISRLERVLRANGVNSGTQSETFTLVNSFWETLNPDVRYLELLGAMRANLMNRGLSELVVLYETLGPNRTKACNELSRTLTQPLKKQNLWHTTITCHGRPRG